jgi:hypothetical protein
LRGAGPHGRTVPRIPRSVEARTEGDLIRG